MTRQQPGRSAAFSAAGRIFSRRSMRPVTRAFSNLHAAMYRLTRGMAQSRKYPTMLLTVTGRRSSEPHTVPLIYIKDGERFVIAAAYAGSDTDPAWWLNLPRESPCCRAGEQRHVRRQGGTCPGGAAARFVAAAGRHVSVLHRIPAADEPRDPRGDPRDGRYAGKHLNRRLVLGGRLKEATRGPSGSCRVCCRCSPEPPEAHRSSMPKSPRCRRRGLAIPPKTIPVVVSAAYAAAHTTRLHCWSARQVAHRRGRSD